MLLKVAIFLLLANGRVAFVWERSNGERTDMNKFQHVPPANETAKKITENFLGVDPNLGKGNRKSDPTNSVPPILYAQFDAIFLIDASGSISLKDYRRTLEALKLLAEKAPRERRFAGISFSNNATIRFNFTERKHAVKKLVEIPFEGGKTNTQKALKLCMREFIRKTNSGTRTGFKKRILITTDGQSNVDTASTLYRAYQLKKAGVEIFVIAVGKYIRGMTEIVTIASSTDAHLYRVENAKGLLKVVRLIPPWHVIKSNRRRTWLKRMLQGGN